MRPLKHFKIAGILILILGIIHCCATPFILPNSSTFVKDDLLTFIYMFICTGIATMLLGWLQYYIAKQEKIVRETKVILLVTVALVLIMGIIAVIIMCYNPFAYIFLIIALYEVIWIKPVLKSIQTQ